MGEPTTTLTKTMPPSSSSTLTATSTKSLWTVGPTTGTVTATITAQPSSSMKSITNSTEEVATTSMTSMNASPSPATPSQAPDPIIDVTYNNTLSPRAKVRIGVGVGLGCLIIFSLLAVFFWFGKRTARRESVLPVHTTDVEVADVKLATMTSKQRVSELGSESEYRFRAELRGSDVPNSELDARGTEIGEFETVERPQEMNHV